MLSRGERIFWGAVAALAVAGAAAAWWTQARWLPHAGPWLEQVWRSSTRPGPDTLPPGRKPAAAAQAAASEPARPPRKCVQGGRTTYTDQPCPAGSQEQAVERGAVMSVPPPGASERP